MNSNSAKETPTVTESQSQSVERSPLTISTHVARQLGPSVPVNGTYKRMCVDVKFILSQIRLI
jgi:hypothetical protein